MKVLETYTIPVVGEVVLFEDPESGAHGRFWSRASSSVGITARFCDSVESLREATLAELRKYITSKRESALGELNALEKANLDSGIEGYRDKVQNQSQSTIRRKC